MTDTKENPFSKPADDDGAIIIPGMNEVDTNPFWVPPGRYAATVTGVEPGLSNSGNPKVVLTFSISKALEVDKPDPKAVGKDLKQHLAITKKALWKVRQSLEGLGVECNVAELRIQPKELLGKKCVIVVEDNDFNGEVSSSIRAVKPLDEKKGKK